MSQAEEREEVIAMTRSAPSVEDKIDQALAANDAAGGNGNGTNQAAKATPAKATPTPRRRTQRTQTSAVAEDVNAYQLTAFTTRDVPWMKLGAEIETAVTAAEAAQRGGLDFQVELLDCGFKSELPKGSHQSPWKVVPKRRAVVKDDGTFFAFVSDTYKPIQYAEAFAFMDEVNPQYVAAGTLGGGRQGFMVVEHPEVTTSLQDLKLGGVQDPHTMYLVLRTSHDLSRALEVSMLTLRGKCMNAVSLRSFSRGAAHHWSIRHVGPDPLAKLQVARETLIHAGAYAAQFKEVAQKLASIDLELEEARSVLKLALPDRPKREDQMNAIVHAWRDAPTNGFPKNGWGLLNAVSEYFEWGREDNTRTPQSRFTGGLEGSTYKFTNRTAQLLLQRHGRAA